VKPLLATLWSVAFYGVLLLAMFAPMLSGCERTQNTRVDPKAFSFEVRPW
jgi:hypothetical protein